MKQSELDLTLTEPVTISDSTCDSDFYTFTGDNITITTQTPPDTGYTIDALGFDTYKDITIDTGNLFEDLPVKVGKYELTEKTLEKVIAVIDIFENDEDLKDILKSQIALNRIKNEN